MDWVHCNSCFYQPGQLPKREFRLTSCGHIFCHCCEHSGNIDQCKMCGVKCTTTLLTSEMAKEVQDYFEDPERILREKIIKVMEFQRSHRLKLVQNFRNVQEKYQLAKKTIQKLQTEIESLKKENDVLKRRQMNKNVMSSSPSNSRLPLFSHNSQASQVIRKMGGASPSTQSSPFFATPRNHHQYRQSSQRINTPSTPMSNASSTSPLSMGDVSPRGSFRNLSMSGRAPSLSSLSYRPGLTPPLNSLRQLSVNNMKPRTESRF